ncbi:MAG: DUF1549 domain-containing protein [Pirellulaceae bacterium]|jgi:hypothetical protein
MQCHSKTFRMAEYLPLAWTWSPCRCELLWVVLLVVLSTFGSWATSPLVAQEASSHEAASWELSDRIDARFGQQHGPIESWPMATDTEFLRRVYLDLTGRNPQPAEVRRFLEDSRPDKRRLWVDSLIHSTAFAARLADSWTRMLVGEGRISAGLTDRSRRHLRTWLMQRFAANQRYDRVVADLLMSKGEGEVSPIAFFVAQEFQPEKLAEKSCRVFLGLSLDCAQCHDHPFAPWKQEDFWGVAAYFAQIQVDGQMMTPGSLPGLSDLLTGDVKLPDSQQIIPPKALTSRLEESNARGTRRQQLALWLTNRENPWFAANASNRMWAMLMGEGLIEPIDQLPNDANEIPDTLRLLADDFRANRYDLRRLVRAIAGTRWYARSSSSEVASALRMPAKPLTGDQMAASLRDIARDIAGETDSDLWASLAQQLGALRAARSDYAGDVLQALQLQNGPSLDQLVNEASSRLLKALKAPHLTQTKRLEELFWLVLARPPRPEEQEALASWQNESSSSDSNKDLSIEEDLLWALLNSTEFAMTP